MGSNPSQGTFFSGHVNALSQCPLARILGFTSVNGEAKRELQ